MGNRMKFILQAAGVVIIAALVLNLGNLGAIFGSRTDASSAVTLDKAEYAYGEPIIITFHKNPNPEERAFGYNPQFGTQRTVSTMTLSSLAVVMDGTQVSAPYDTVSMGGRPYGASASSVFGVKTPLKAVSVPLCSDFCSASEGGACIYSCVINEPKSTPTPHDILATVSLPQYLPAGTHEIAFYWGGYYGCIAPTSVNGYVMDYDCGGHGEIVPGAEPIYAIKTFTVKATSTAPVCAGATQNATCLITTAAPCAPGQTRQGDYCIYPVSQPNNANAEQSTQNSVLTAQLAALEQQLAAAQAPGSTSAEQAAQLQAEITVLKAQLNAAPSAADVAQLQAQVASLTSQLNDAKNAPNPDTAKVAQLQAQLDALTKQQTAPEPQDYPLLIVGVILIVGVGWLLRRRK